MELFRSRSRAYSTLLLWMAVIFFFSSMSGSISGTIVSYDNLLVRKSAHVFEYLVLSFLSYNAFRLTYPRERRGFVILLSVVLSLLYAFSDETHQLFVPGREGKLTDVGIDLIGIAIGMIAVGTL
ncbi:MAG TPA: VanZ family protein, partial [Candidatus Fimivivens sp.]|nr:VanZ family protein [Candidatus Fimivivens sp.]